MRAIPHRQGLLLAYRQGLLPSVRVFVDYLAAELPKAVLMETVDGISDRQS
jgi:hypothetical protein